MQNLFNTDGRGDRAIFRKLHLNWGRVSATQLKRILVDAENVSSAASLVVDGVLKQREVRPAFDKAPRVTSAGAPTVSDLNGKAQADSLILDDIATLSAMDGYSKCSLPVRASSGNLLEVWESFAASWIAVPGKPSCFQMDAGRNW